MGLGLGLGLGLELGLGSGLGSGDLLLGKSLVATTALLTATLLAAAVRVLPPLRPSG